MKRDGENLSLDFNKSFPEIVVNYSINEITIILPT